jgi:hypothetical protein
LDFVDACEARRVGGGCVELGAGVALFAKVAGGEEEDFAVGAGGVESVGGGWGDEEEGGSGLVPAGEVVEVGVLAVGSEVGFGLFGGEEDRDALVEGFAEMDAAGVIVGGGLAVEREEGRSGREEEKSGEAGKFRKFH